MNNLFDRHDFATVYIRCKLSIYVSPADNTQISINSKDLGVQGLVPICARTLNCTGQFVQTLFEQGSLAIVTLLRQTLRSFCVFQI